MAVSAGDSFLLINVIRSWPCRRQLVTPQDSYDQGSNESFVLSSVDSTGVAVFVNRRV